MSTLNLDHTILQRRRESEIAYHCSKHEPWIKQSLTAASIVDNERAAILSKLLELPRPFVDHFSELFVRVTMCSARKTSRAPALFDLKQQFLAAVTYKEIGALALPWNRGLELSVFVAG